MSGSVPVDDNVAAVVKAAIKGKGEMLREIALGLRPGEGLRITRSREGELLVLSFRDEIHVSTLEIHRPDAAKDRVIYVALRDCMRRVRDYP